MEEMFDRMPPPDQIRLVALDLDGTLLTSEKRLTTPTIAVLGQLAQRADLAIAITTGRRPFSVRSMQRELAINTWRVCLNGARIESPCGTMVAVDRTLPANPVAELALALKRLPSVIPMIFSGDGLISKPGAKALEKYFISWGTPVDIQESVDLAMQDHVHMAIILGKSEEIDDLETSIASSELIESYRYQTNHTDLAFIEIRSAGVDKGSSLAQIQKQLGISPAETLAIGDWRNDLCLRPVSGTLIAMANSCPELKTIADLVTEQNNDHEGAALALKSFFRL